MREPTTQELARLKEIVMENVHDSFEVNRALGVAIAVWREAQEEIAKAEASLYVRWEKDQKEIQQLEASLNDLTVQNQLLKRQNQQDAESLRNWEQRAREAHNDMMRVVAQRDELQASLKLAVEALTVSASEMKQCDDAFNRHGWMAPKLNAAIGVATDVLSTIRANHPALFREEKK